MHRIIVIDYELPWTLDGVRTACAALTTVNRMLIQQAKAAGKPYPQLYTSGVAYLRNRAINGRAARFRPIPSVIANRGADCGPLACWRAAELQVAGEKARAVPVRINSRLMHVVVRRANGSYEDPSRLLGM